MDKLTELVREWDIMGIQASQIGIISFPKMVKQLADL